MPQPAGLFLGIVDARLAAFARSKTTTPFAPPPPAARPIPVYGGVYGQKAPERATSW